MKEYLLTPAQIEMRDMFRDFANKAVAPIVQEYDTKGEMPMSVFKEAAEMGLTTLRLPEKFGGSGLDCLTDTLMVEELARVDAGFAVAVGANELATIPLMLGGNDAQVQKVADYLLNGELAAFCLTEAAAGSDAASLTTTAVKDGDDWIINGSKCFITNGGVASVYTVFATVDRSLGTKGITCFIIERDREGVSVGKEEDKMGIRLSNTTEVIFQDVRIPDANRVGEIGQGLKLALGTLDRTRAEGSAAAVGICQHAIDIALKYAQERVTFGKPIIANQAIQFMIADMEIQTVAARQLVRYGANLMDSGVADPEIGSIIKTFCGDAAMKIAVDCVQVLGGYGYSREYPAEKLMRDAKIYQIFEGTNQIQRLTIIGDMLKAQKQ